VFCVNTVFGIKARHPSDESTDGDTMGLREFLISLIDLTARKALVSSSGWKKTDPIGRCLFLFLVKDELFWDLLDSPTLHDALNWVVPARSEWALSDPCFRIVMEKIVYVEYWQTFSPPDLYDGMFGCWMCDLSGST
jgi:hypothetical protein